MKIADAVAVLCLLAACETPVSDSVSPDEFNLWYAMTDAESQGGLARTTGDLALDSFGAGEASTLGFGLTWYLSAPTIRDRGAEASSLVMALDARDARTAKLKAQAEAAAKDAHAVEHEGPELPPGDDPAALMDQLWAKLTALLIAISGIVTAWLNRRRLPWVGHGSAGAPIPPDDVGD